MNRDAFNWGTDGPGGENGCHNTLTRLILILVSNKSIIIPSSYDLTSSLLKKSLPSSIAFSVAGLMTSCSSIIPLPP